VLQLVAIQLSIPVVLPLMIPTGRLFTENDCCQSSEQLPPWMQVEEQL